MTKHNTTNDQTLPFNFDGLDSDLSGGKPTWQFKYLDDVDFISEEAVCAISFDIKELERASTSGSYLEPAIKSLFAAFNGLRENQIKSLHNQSFTVFGGDLIGYGLFVLALASPQAKVVDFLASYLRKMPGQRFVDAGSSADFMPMFRYDAGYVIEYVEEGSEGEAYIDNSDNYGSGLTIYRRSWQPSENVECHRSVYGKLVR